MTPEPSSVAYGRAEIAVANVVALLLPLPIELLDRLAAEHARIRDDVALDDPSRPFMDAGAAASAAVAECRRALLDVTPPVVVIDGDPVGQGTPKDEAQLAHKRQLRNAELDAGGDV